IMDPLDQVVAFRAFDLRDRFPQPFQTFCQALEALQSDTAYLPQWSGSISAYLKDGRSIEIPYSFFIVRTRRFETPDKAEAWVRDRLKRIEEKGGAVQAFGLLVTNPNDPLDKQIEDAYDTMDS